MKNLKTYEGFFDFFKSKTSEDDEIALAFIKRLKKVKGISPYKITKDDTTDGDSYTINRWNVDFEDTPIKLWVVISTGTSGFDGQSQELLLSKNFAKYSRYEFYGLNIKCEGELENCKASAKVLKKLVELVEKIYKEDKEARRIERIKINMNDAADLIEDESDNEN